MGKAETLPSELEKQRLHGPRKAESRKRRLEEAPFEVTDKGKSSKQSFVTLQQIEEALRKVALEYPAELAVEQAADVSRIAFNIFASLPPGRALNEVAICDIGGGVGMFSVGCGAIGLGKVILVDDFKDEINQVLGDSVFAVHRRYGVRIAPRDVVAQGLGDLGGPVDVITSFDSMEHWHHSPKRVLREMVSVLKPGGRFVLAVPNCVNLRKRLTVPFGRGNWSAMKDWYEPEKFRGHVREPDVQDLQYIADDLNLEDVRILGRNWLGYQSGHKLVRVLTGFLDPLLRLRPSLCSDIYLIGHRPNA